MAIQDDLARNLRNLRHEKNLSQEVLADAAGIDRTYISALERGLYSVSIATLDKLAKALGVEPADLLRPTAKGGRGKA